MGNFHISSRNRKKKSYRRLMKYLRGIKTIRTKTSIKKLLKMRIWSKYTERSKRVKTGESSPY